MDNQFDYSAFISYKRADEKWAKWLQNHLERYSIPSSIRKEIPRLPQKIKPVFRDKTDLGAGGLTASIHKELERSHFLIVICSPRSASSDWVGDEINYFRELGREEQIIPFIIDGIPNSEDPDKECFHPVFKRFADEPLGINVKEIGKRQALIKVLAKILDLRFDALWRRHLKYTRKKQVNTALVALLICTIGLLYWYYTKPMYKYFADYVDKWGIPEGVVELDKTAFEHRYRTYRFEYQRIPLGEPDALSWRLSKVEYVNSAGQPQEHEIIERSNRFAIQILEYNPSSGTIRNIDFCNKSGKTIARWKVSSRDGIKATVIDFIGITDVEASGYLNAITTISSPSEYDSFINSPKSSIKRYVLTRDTSGYITSMTYHANNSDNINSSKTTDANGIYKLIFTNDSLGRISTMTFCNLNEDIFNRKDGVAIIKYEYDKWSNLRKTEYYNSHKEYVLNDMLCAKITSESDEWGNIVKNCNYDTDGLLCFDKYNISQLIFDYDKRGFPITVTSLDTKGLPCLNLQGFSKMYIKTDKRGNQTEIKYEGINRKPCVNKDGIAKISAEYDRWNNPVYMAAYDINDNPTTTPQGVAGWNQKFDKYGNCIQCDYFGADGKACIDNNGIATWKAEYDSRGYLTQIRYYDVDGFLTANTEGYASIKYVINERGNFTESSYYGIDGLPCLRKDGVHKVSYKYDDFGNMIECQFYDTNDSLCNSNDGFAIRKTTPDSLGNIIQNDFYKVSDNHAERYQRSKIIKYKYDELGRLTSVRIYNGEGIPMLNEEKIAGWDTNYDYRGNQIEHTGIGINGELCCDTSGVARWIKKFDKRNNQLFFASYDDKNNLTPLKNGVASVKNEFNDRGFITKSVYYDENNQPCINKDVGYSSMTTKYNEMCETTEICTYDENGNLCIDPQNGYAKWVGKYDGAGNKIEMLSYSDKDSLCVCKHGYARWTANYDKDGVLIGQMSYDTEGNYIITKTENNKYEVVHVKKFNLHRFYYDTSDMIFGFILLFLSIGVFIKWTKEISSNTIKKNLWYLAGIIVLPSISYVYLRLFLLHFSLIPYKIYNYSWIIHLISAMICLIITIKILVQLGTIIISIMKTPNYHRKTKFKDSIDKLIIHTLGATFLILIICSLLDEGWKIYSMPLSS